jgi:threonyl-tRNA synthetase
MQVEEIKVTLPDGSVIQFKKGVSGEEVAKAISERLLKDAVAMKVNGILRDITSPLDEDCSIEILTSKNKESLEIYRHSTAHLLANAVKELFPETKIAIGPVIEDGFYYDFDRETPFIPEDLPEIEKKMLEISKRGNPIERQEVSSEEAVKLFKGEDEPYKVELVTEKGQGGVVSIYKQGNFTDFCRGPHLSTTSKIKEGTFKLLSIAGAYWKGDEKNKMLQRIYGTSFFTKKELDEHLKKLEEARLRDHRKLGRELDLFSVADEIGGGLILWHPKGAIVRKTIEDFWRSEHITNGYEFVFTPHIGRSTLWETSGHLDFYKENMYPKMEMENQTFYAKPMNCPFHVMIYKSRHRSYRELPLRWAELGTVYRYEKSGVLHGLMRVRGFTQDDAHLFVPQEEMEKEVVSVINFTIHILKSFGFTEFSSFIATKPEKSVGENERWEAATEALKRAAESVDLLYEIDKGGGAFYGPKIDIKIKDALGRSWQLSTVQFDFNLPEKFHLEYIGKDNKPHTPYMIHRALLGSLERFFGILIENFAGAFPLWLAPEQVRIMSIADRHIPYCERLLEEFKEKGIRCSSDFRAEKINYKIREAQLEKVPYMLIAGDKEIENESVSLRTRSGGDRGSKKVVEFLDEFFKKVESKEIKLD